MKYNVQKHETLELQGMLGDIGHFAGWAAKFAVLTFPEWGWILV